MKVWVVIPVYNEAATIAEVVRRVRGAPPAQKVIVVVDDGSTDGTCEVVRRMESSREVAGVYRERNAGKGASLRAGFALALRDAADDDVVIVQDADLEYDPREHERLMAPIVGGSADVVYGSRFAGGEAHRVLYFWHYAGNRLLTLLSNALTNLNLTDMETGAKAFRAGVLRRITLEEDGFGFEPEVTAKVAALGCRVYEVGVPYFGRTYAEGKKIGWRDGVWALWCIVKYNLRPKGRGGGAGRGGNA